MAGIRASLRKLLSLTGQKNAEVSVLLVGDKAMRSLNRRYRGKDRTTDVLSFPLREGRFIRIQPHVLGDIVLSLPRRGRQRRQERPTIKRSDGFWCTGICTFWAMTMRKAGLRPAAWLAGNDACGKRSNGETHAMA